MKYIRLHLSEIPDEIMNEYRLLDKATSNRFVDIDVVKGMYGLLKVKILEQALLDIILRKQRYYQK